MTTNTDGAMPELPENIREGAPYDNARFEELCREHDIWGTAESAMCAVFWRTAIQQAAGAVPEVPPAMERFNASIGDESDPIERLRFFCSIAMNGQDWIDVEPLFDALIASPAPPKQQPVHLGGGEVGGVQRYRLLTTDDHIESSDEFIQDDGVTWRKPVGWEIRAPYSSVFKTARRPIASHGIKDAS